MYWSYAVLALLLRLKCNFWNRRSLGLFAARGALSYHNIFRGGVFYTKEAASIGYSEVRWPTSIYTASVLAPDLLPIITIAAYSYMALVPLIQPPIVKALTTDKERLIEMPNQKRVSKRSKIIFAFGITIATLVLVPEAGTLIAMLMLGNLIRESGVTERYVRTLQNHLLNILTLLIGLSIGATATAERILNPKTLLIIILGLFAFALGTVGGVLVTKLLCFITGGKINPLIGNSGVSAMPMAARVSQRLGQEYNPHNHLLMHAMGPIVSSTIGSAIVAGVLISILG